MSTVVNRMTLTPLFDRDLSRYDIAHFWHNPDLSAVADVDPIYWKETSGVFSEMTLTEKGVKDAEIVAANADRDRRFAKRRIAKRDLIAFAEVIMDELNILRAEHSLTLRQLSQVESAIERKIDAAQ